MVSPLDRKLLRGIWRIRGQAAAIAIVIALGVLLLVMMNGLVMTLDETRRAYYERYRLADIFAPVERAPSRIENELNALPGVSAVDSRITGNALVDLEEVDVPLRARVVSLPVNKEPRLNNVFLASGRKLDSARSEEILLLKAFADAHSLGEGDTISATMNGIRHRLRIVGLARSPEFLYTTAPGEIVPDDGRYAVIWMSETALAAAYDMDGAFNEALIALGPDARSREVLDAADRLLKAYGGTGAFSLDDLPSNRFVTEEIAGLRASAVSVPPIFLGVSAFLLYIVISRIVQNERERIGLLKAFGYTGLEVSFHYLKLVLIVAITGSVAGMLLGVASGRAMANLYLDYFKFPFLVFHADARVFIIAFAVSTTTASLGALGVLRGVFKLTPAVAMRPPAPIDYSSSRKLAGWFRRFLDQPARMMLRRVFRQPGRIAGSILGIAFGMALSAGIMNVMSGFQETMSITFNVVNRSDATVSFIHPLSRSAVYKLQNVTGINHVEPFRSVAVVFRNGLRDYRGAISGIIDNPVLDRALDTSHQPIELPRDGIILSEPLADILHIKPGQMLTVEVREGRKPVLEIPVAGISQTLLGAPSFMRLETLNRYMNEPGRIAGAHITIDPAFSSQVYREVKNMPAVAGLSLRGDMRKAFEKILDEGAGATRYVMAIVAAIITFGIVYNSARIAFAERERDLASLRVIGFSRGETAFVLLGELGLVTLLALPLGAVLGYFFSFAIAEGYSTDIYQIPTTFVPESYGFAAIAVIAAALVSGWLVKRNIDKLDLVSALKSKE